MPSMKTDQFGNPIWVPDDPLAAGDPFAQDPGAAEAPAGLPGPELDIMRALEVAKTFQRPEPSTANDDLSPGTGPAVGNLVPDTSPWAARPQDPYPGTPGPATVTGQYDSSGRLLSGQPQPGELGGGQPMDPYAHNAATRAAAPAVTPRGPGDASELGNVAGAMAAEDRALETATRARMEAADAAFLAASETADRKASAQELYAKALAENDATYQRARQAARAEAEADTARWLTSLEQKAKEEPSPSRYWENTSNFGKALWLLSLAFGTIGAAKAPGVQNIAVTMFNAELDRDRESQKERLARELEAMKARGERMTVKQRERLADLMDDHTAAAQRLIGVRDASLERANAPGPADRKAAYMAQAQWAGEQLLGRAAKRTDQAYNERDAELSRQNALRQAYITDARTRAIAVMDDQTRRDLATMEIGAKLSGTPEILKDTVTLDPELTGVRVLDKSGKPIGGPGATGGITLDKKTADQLANRVATSHQVYNALNRLSKALGKDDDWAALLGRDAELNALISQLGYTGAKTNDPRGIVTDKDFQAGIKSELGIDLGSFAGALKAATIGAGQKEAKKLIDMKIRGFKKDIERHLGASLNTQIPGYREGVRIDWTPLEITEPEPETPSISQTRAERGLPTESVPLTSVKDLERAQALGKQALPPYRSTDTAEKVRKAVADYSSADPRTIREMAEVDKKEVAGDRRAELEIEQAADKAAKKAEKALKDWTDDLRTWAPTHTRLSDADKIEVAKEKASEYGIGSIPDAEILRTLKTLRILKSGL